MIDARHGRTEERRELVMCDQKLGVRERVWGKVGSRSWWRGVGDGDGCVEVREELAATRMRELRRRSRRRVLLRSGLHGAHLGTGTCPREAMEGPLSSPHHSTVSVREGEVTVSCSRAERGKAEHRAELSLLPFPHVALTHRIGRAGNGGASRASWRECIWCMWRT